MLMHEKPNRRKTFGLNAKKAWYIFPCFKHYQTFKGILQSTGAERMSDTVRFKHHAIAIPQLTSAYRILEAARQLDDAIKQQPKKSPMENLTAIEVLREVILGGKKEKLPKNSVQTKKAQHKIVAPKKVAAKPAYYEDEDKKINHRARRSKRVMTQKRKYNNNRIVFLAANETADITALTVKSIGTRGLGGANMHLQLDEWAYDEYFDNAIIDENALCSTMELGK